MEYKVGVILVNYNQEDFTSKCIDSLLSSSHKNIHINVIDNSNSKENQIQFKEYYSNKVNIHLMVENLGYVGGINFGFTLVEKIDPEYLLILNNDTIIDEYAIERLISCCKIFENKAIVTGKVYHYDNPEVLQDVGSVFSNKKLMLFKRLGLNELDNGQYDRIDMRDMIDDKFWLFPFKLYKEIGGYSNYFWFNSEQADFALRAKGKGYKLIYTPEAKLYHKGSASIGGLNDNPKQAYWTIQSSLILRYLHLSRWNFFVYYLFIVQSILRTILKALFYKWNGEKDLMLYAKSKYKGLVYFNHWILKKHQNSGENPFD